MLMLPVVTVEDALFSERDEGEQRDDQRDPIAYIVDTLFFHEST